MRRLRASGSWLVVAILSTVSCARTDGEPADTTVRGALGATSFTFAVSVPAGIDPTLVVVGAADRLTIADRSVVDPATAGPRPFITNTGTSQSSFGADTQTRADVASRASVFLADRASIAGGITTEGTVTRQNGTIVGGTIREHQPIAAAPVSWTVAFPASSELVSLEPGQTRAIAPGVYADAMVKTGATLTLTASGTYFFDALSVEPGGTVILNGSGPFTIYVRANLTLKGPLARPAGAPPVPTTVAFAGSNSVYVSTVFQGTLVAPNAALTLANINTAVHDASFFARSVDLQASVHIRHRPATLGPLETLTPPASGGEFRCALVGQSAAVFASSQTSTLLGSAMLTLKPSGSFTLDALDGRGSSVCSGGVCSKIALRPDPTAVNVGSFVGTGGAIQASLAARLRFVDRSNREASVVLALQGQLQHRRFSAFATGTLPADSPLFPGAPLAVSITCDQQEPHQIVEVTFNVDSNGAVSAPPPVVRAGNRPVFPHLGGDYVLRSFDERGGRLDELSFADPRLQFDAGGLLTGVVTLRVPFANGIRTLVLDGPTGPGLVQLDLSGAASAFCVSRTTNPECKRIADPGAIPATTLAAFSGPDPVPGVNTPRARGAEVHVAFPPNTQGSAPNDFNPSVAAVPSGTIAVTWFHNASQNRNIMLRFFDQDGRALAAAQGLLSAGMVPSGKAHVSGSNAGQFVVAWDEIAPATGVTNVITQRFSAAGQPMGGRVVAVSGTTSASPVGSNVALDGAGRFTVAWIEARANGTSVLRAQRFGATDQADGGVMNVSDSLQNLAPAIAADNLGRFVIAYNETRFSTNTNVFRRFDQNRNAAAPTEVESDHNPDLAIAMTPDTGEFTLLRSDGSQILAGQYSATGAVKSDDFGSGMRAIRLDGRIFGNQRRPAVAILPGGEMLTAWSSATAVHRSEIRVSAQDYTTNLLPLDIDFDVGTSRTDARSVGEQGADPVPQAAALANRFAVVWEAPGGIRMQLFDTGAYPCPANVNCGPGTPLMVNGDPENTFNLTIVRGDPCFQGGDTITRSVNPNGLARLAALYVGSSFVDEVIEANRRRLNVFRGEPGACIGGANPATTNFPDMDVVAFASDITSDFQASVTKIAQRTMVFAYQEVGTYRHESGHAMFNLADEYGCVQDFGTVRHQPPIHGNLFSDLDTCMALSADSTACRLLNGAPASCTPQKSWAKADRDDDVMVGARQNPTGSFGADCKAQIREMFERFPCPFRGSSTCQ